MNFYPFHIGDYISHTSHLTDAEDLAYRRMMDLYYQTEQAFTSPEFVARKVKSTTEIVTVLLQEFFVQAEDGLWHNTRADEEIAKYRSKADSARNANRIKSEKITALKSEQQSEQESAKVSVLKSEPNHNVTKNQEPLTNNQIKTKNITPPSGVDESVWNDFVAHRKSKKAPISATALKGIESEARKANITLQAALELCVMRGWTGFKAEWIEEKKTATDKSKAVLSGLTRGLMGGNNAGLLTI